MSSARRGGGGTGGSAHVLGNDSSATGGRGGDAVVGSGGNGGEANVIGDRSTAIGGEGGRGGIGNGQPGGNVALEQDDAFAAGGQGGEASQPDGRGGRGGRAYQVHRFFDLPYRPHMKAPYWSPQTEFGRGGDAPDSPQYLARRLIVEGIKANQLHATALFTNDVWYDRTVSSDILNLHLARDGHLWRVTVVDHEYEFSDCPQDMT